MRRLVPILLLVPLLPGLVAAQAAADRARPARTAAWPSAYAAAPSLASASSRSSVRRAPPPPSGRMFVGGGLGLSFGDVDYVSLSPYIGFHVNPYVDAGVGLQYSYRNDSRYDRSLTTNDYGGDLFTRVFVAEGLFVGASYEYLRYEFYDVAGEKLSDDYSSVFVGGGFAQPMGGASAFIVSAMYNLSWSNDEPSPYDSPWVVGAGVSVGF